MASYLDLADREQMPDVWCLLDWLADELEALKR